MWKKLEGSCSCLKWFVFLDNKFFWLSRTNISQYNGFFYRRSAEDREANWKISSTVWKKPPLLLSLLLILHKCIYMLQKSLENVPLYLFLSFSFSFSCLIYLIFIYLLVFFISLVLFCKFLIKNNVFKKAIYYWSCFTMVMEIKKQFSSFTFMFPDCYPVEFFWVFLLKFGLA